MPVFRYVAVSLEGAEDQGVIEADTPRQARALLRERNLTALSIAAVAPANARASAALRSGELSLITRQFAALLTASLTVEQALNALIEQSINPVIRDILVNLRIEVRAGTSLAEAMGRQPKAFPDLYRALVRGGEEAGSLPRVMAELADHLEAREEIRQKLMLALLYPATIALVAALVVGGLLIYVLPQIAVVFEQSKQALPWLTQALLGFSRFLRQTGLAMLLTSVAGIVSLRQLYRRTAFRQRVQRALLATPLVGHLLTLEAGARFGNTLAILLAGGVPMLRAIGVAAEGSSLDIFRDSARRAAERVREGAPLSRALKIENRYPPLLLHFIASGEASGELPGMLRQAGKQIQGELDIRLRWLGGLLEPALIVTMGLIVLLIVLAILMPIIETNHLLH